MEAADRAAERAAAAAREERERRAGASPEEERERGAESVREGRDRRAGLDREEREHSERRAWEECRACPAETRASTLDSAPGQRPLDAWTARLRRRAQTVSGPQER